MGWSRASGNPAAARVRTGANCLRMPRLALSLMIHASLRLRFAQAQLALALAGRAHSSTKMRAHSHAHVEMNAALVRAHSEEEAEEAEEDSESPIRKKLRGAMSLVDMAGLDGRLTSGEYKNIGEALHSVWKGTRMLDTSVSNFGCESVCIELLLSTPTRAMSGKLGMLCRHRLFCNRLLHEKQQEQGITHEILMEWATQLFAGCVVAAFCVEEVPELAHQVLQSIVLNLLRWQIGIVQPMTKVLKAMKVEAGALFPTSIGDGATFPSFANAREHVPQPAEEALRLAPTFVYYLVGKKYGTPWPINPHANRLRSGTIHSLQRVTWDGYLIEIANCHLGLL